MLHICTRCDGMGQERRKITHPAANVYGWTPEPGYPLIWWRRTCERCNGEGFIESGGTSVPKSGPKVSPSNPSQ